MSDSEKQDQQTSDTGPDTGSDTGSGGGSGDAGTLQAVGDEQLPEDLRPSDDNPLAQPLDPDDEATKDPEELDLQGGKPAEEWDSEDEPDTDD